MSDLISKNIKPCKHNLELDEIYGEYYCIKCFQIFGVQFINKTNEFKQSKSHISLWNTSYDRQRWKAIGLEYLSGENNEYLGNQILLELAREIPEKFKWYDVYQVYRKYKITDYWSGFGSFIDIKPLITPKIMYYVDKYIDTCSTKYRIPYQYLIYKFAQMFDGDEAALTIPLHRSRNWLLKTDIWWETFCKQEKFKYIDSKIFQITWDKYNILKAHAKNIKQFNDINNKK